MHPTLASFIWQHLKTKKLYIFGFVIVGIIWSAELSISPSLLGKIINTVAIESASRDTTIQAILPYVILYISMSIIINLNFRLYDLIAIRLYPHLRADMVSSMYSYLVNHSVNFFADNYAGTLTKKIQDMSTNIELIVQIPSEWFFPRFFALIIGCTTLYINLSWQFSIVFLIWGISFVFVSFMAAKTSESYAHSLAKTESKINGHLSDSITNINSIKLFTNIKHELARNDLLLTKMIHQDKRFKLQNLKIFFIQGISVTILVTVMMFLLISGYRQGEVKPGDFALVLGFTVTFTIVIFEIGQQMLKFSKTLGVCNQALSFMRQPIEILDRKGAPKLVVVKAQIEFKDVCFKADQNSFIFDKLNLTIKHGERIGLVGKSGAGKTSLVKLLLRLVEPESGVITIDDQDINLVLKDSLRSNISLIPQNNELFHRSILDNIRIAKPDATDSEIIKAAKQANCHDFICSLPEGYDSFVGQQGLKLSGGQRQRIAIARAFLKDAPILVLDEATSALDSITERRIQDSLNRVMLDKTTIVIAHRLSTIFNMDRILVMEDGKIIEQGVPQKLIEDKNSIFNKMWQMQAKDFDNLD